MSCEIDIEKSVGSFRLRVKLQAENETVALLGASGSGKSMTLKCIAGIEKPDRGRIIVDGVTLFDSEKRINLSPQARRTGLMFQNYALFPNMTVGQNIALGAKREKDKEKRKEQIQKVLESFGLQELASRSPDTLSGGERQRVALARILLSEPRILLLDEPFSALDSHLRMRLEQEVRQVISEFGKTVILVSHDRNEVFHMSDRVAVLERGAVMEEGQKHAVFSAPQTLQGARLIGCENITSIRRMNGELYLEAWDISLGRRDLAAGITAAGVRGEDIRQSDDGQAYLVKDIMENTDSLTIILNPVEKKDGSCLFWKVSKTDPVAKIGDEIKIRIPEDKIFFLRDGLEGVVL